MFSSQTNGRVGRGCRARGPVSPKPRSGEGGFSLIEALLVVGILGTLAAVAIPVSSTMIKQGKADSATAIAVAALQDARDRAIAERRNIQLTFVAPNRIRLERIEVPGPGTTLLAQAELEGFQTFQLVTGIPDTPDRFGNDTAVDFTGTAPVMFTSDGSLIDANGDPANGTIFLAGPTSARDSVRAITILGVTGLVRTWKFSESGWIE